MIFLSNGTIIYYETIGSGIPILHLHGFMLEHHSLKNQLEPIYEKFTEKGNQFKRIYLDFPGVGNSIGDHYPENADQLYLILESFINEVIGNQPFIVTGLSYGGYFARKIMGEMGNRVIGLALIVPVINAEPEKRVLPEFEKVYKESIKVEPHLKQAFNEYQEIAVKETQTSWDLFCRDILPYFSNVDMDYLERYQNFGYSFSNRIKDISNNLPLLFIAGKQDNIVGFQDFLKIKESYPHSSIHILDGTGHMLNLEEPQLFESIYRSWLEKFLTDRVS